MALFNSRRRVKMHRLLCLLVILSQVLLDNVVSQPRCSPIDYTSSNDIPACTFGCFCIGERVSLYYGWFRSNTVCRYPECDGVVECANPAVSCGCPTCNGRQDCVAVDDNGQEVIIDSGQPQQVGCAICECNPAEPAVPLPESSSGSIPIQQRRNATCDYSQCVCQDYDESQVFDNVSDIPSCTFGCFCIRSENVALCIDPGPCEVSNKCQHPADICGCPVCSDTDDDCFASFDDEEVLISGNGPQDVGCAVCTCDAPVTPITIPFFTPGTPIPLIPSRNATCDYSQCVCQGYDESQIFDNVSDIPSCTFGCFCIRAHNAELCADPPLCEVSNLCHNPEIVCGCPACQDEAGDCFAKSADNEEVLISGDGPQIVGCAVCTCNLPTIPVPASSYTQTLGLLPVRTATCDYSQCVCHNYHESQVFDDVSDIPSCTFGCFCIRSENVALCIDPGPCEVSNKCQYPGDVCGCPVCSDTDNDCFAKSFDDEEVLISGDGPQDVGCAVCTCDAPVEPITIPFFTPGTPIPLLPVRNATCDYSQCACQDHEESQVFDNISDIPGCTFGCFCIRNHNAVLCVDPGLCEVSNLCHDPELVCGCPVCQDPAGDCFAKSADDKEILISGDGPQTVGCAVCTCNLPTIPISALSYTQESLPVRTATCDYSQCVCHNYDESKVFDNISDIPSCTFGCFCIRSENVALCIDPGPCELSNKCQHPSDVCGCPVCLDTDDDCFAKSFDDEEVLISGDGPQAVGCAVCTCAAPITPTIIPFFTPDTPLPLLPARGYSCDYSGCYNPYGK